MAKKYFTSDTHFGHRNIIGYCNRPFKSVEEMDEKMIANWNAVVGQDDDVYHTGDFAMGKTAAPTILARLNGNKHLIWGNHDSNQVREASDWASSQPYLELNHEGQFIVLCHYKFDVFNKSHRGGIQLYGHSHNTIKPNTQQLDIGVDAWDFKPVDLTAILRRMKSAEPYRNADYHGEG